MRTVQRWEAGEWEAPETVWAAIEQLENWVEATVKAVVDGMFELHSKQGVSEGAELRRYRSKAQYEKLSDAAGVIPFEVHSHAVWESVKQLRALGVDTIVTYENSDWSRLTSETCANRSGRGMANPSTPTL